MDAKRVTDLLLADGNWYQVVDGTLALGEVTMADASRIVRWDSGFVFTTMVGEQVSGPKSSILAFKYPARGASSS